MLVELEKEYKKDNNLEKLDLIRKYNGEFYIICNEPSQILSNRSKT